MKKTPAYTEVTVSKGDIKGITEGFQQLAWSLQKKHLARAVKRTALSQKPSLKIVTPRRSGGLKKSVGTIVDKAKKRKKSIKFAGALVVGRLGFMRGKTKTGETRSGYISHFIEKGVKARKPKKASMFPIEWSENRKYKYLKALRRRVLDPATGRRKRAETIFLPDTKPVKGTKFFKKFLRVTRGTMSKKLTDETKKELKAAIAAAKAKAAAAAAKKAAKL